MEQLQREERRLLLTGALNKSNVVALLAAFEASGQPATVESLDLSGVESVDSAGVALLDEIQTRISRAGGHAALQNATHEVAEAIATFSSLTLEIPPAPHKPGFFEWIGQIFYAAWQSFVEALFLASDVLYWSLRDLFSRKGHRKGSVITQGVQIGVDALGIIGLLSFIIGLILALQSAAQLRQFGANIFLADLMSISMVREMGPLLTAILLAGRSGSSIASEIATMKVTEELDALRMMAVNPIRYVVVPKFHAVTFCMPILVAFSIFLSLLGGLIIAVSFLGLTATAYVNECIKILAPMDVCLGIGKSIIFAWAVVIIGSFYGFKVEGGAEGVGKATTSSVVTSLFAIVILDALFSLFYLIN